MEFKPFSTVIKNQFGRMSKNELFVVDIDKAKLWDFYLDAFPEGTNEIYKERREYDCQCCRQFIRNIGNVVAIIDGKLVSVWDVDVEGYFQEVADKLSKLVSKAKIKEIFRHEESKFGQDVTHQQLEDGRVIDWNHFHCVVPKEFVSDKHRAITGTHSTDMQVFRRGLTEIESTAIDITLDLIAQDLYRGKEFKAAVVGFRKLKTAFIKCKPQQRDLFYWTNYKEKAARINNTVIGTLLNDLSEGKDINKSVESFELKMGGYKRTTAIVTPAMAQKAIDKINELGLEDSIPRRFAMIEDVSINNVLWANRSTSTVMKGSLADIVLAGASTKNKKNFDKVSEVSIADFIENILPSTESLEVLVKNKHQSNLVSLVAPVAEDPVDLFQWNNNFSWSYNGEGTDSMRDRVVAAGGRVDGVLRFTHAWNHDGNNQSLMDLHVFLPNSGYKEEATGKNFHDNYPRGGRVGWNQRNHKASGGVQDVDFTSAAGKTVPIENITFPTFNSMPEGEYVFRIHNWKLRNTNTSGFKAEIEFGGQIFKYEYPKALKHKEWVTVAKAVLKNGQFTIKHCLPSSESSQEIWGIKTQEFQKVSSVMLSPNFWDDNKEGNKHFFFMLDDCINPEPTRGFYNEFLRKDLIQERKAFEMISSKFMCESTDNQLSGLGFSDTQRNDLIVKVKGNFTRTIKLKF